MMMRIATQHYLNDISLKCNGIHNTQGAWGPFVHAETCQHHITCSCNQHVLIPCFDRGRHTLPLVFLPHAVSSCTVANPPPKHLNYLSWAHSKDVTQIMSILLWIKIQLLPIVKHSWPTMPSEEGLSSFLFLLALHTQYGSVDGLVWRAMLDGSRESDANCLTPNPIPESH